MPEECKTEKDSNRHKARRRLFLVHEVKQVKAFEKSLFDLLERKYLNLLERLESGFYEPEDVAEMKKALDEAKE